MRNSASSPSRRSVLSRRLDFRCVQKSVIVKTFAVVVAVCSQTPLSYAANAPALHPATMPTGASMMTFYGATWTGNQFVVVGENGTILTSPDGMAWTSRSVPLVVPLFAVAGDTSMIVAVGYGSEIWSSSDGSASCLTPTSRSRPIPTRR